MECIKYLKFLSKQFPNIDAVCTEIINLSAILNLPKGTEHFVTDIHGEFEAFSHIVRNASGAVRRKIEDAFESEMSKIEKDDLASLVYYPKEKLVFLSKNKSIDEEWYKLTIYRLVLLFRKTSFKYTRSKVRKSLPGNFSYIIEELVQEQESQEAKKRYYNEIINSIIKTGMKEDFIIELCNVIRRLVVDRLHILGDIYDRGSGAHLIMDDLLNHHSVDFQWGNHDILWMGAAAGSKACIANVMRISLRYANLDTLQDGYGINLMPLAQFAEEFYGEDPAQCFYPVLKNGHSLKERDVELICKMQKAIAIIQFKLEGQIIERNPGFHMEDRLLLDKISEDKKEIIINNRKYKMKDSFFPTLIKNDPYKLTDEESEVIESLLISFHNSEKLQKHIEFLYSKGSLHDKINDNLIYHGCVPLKEDGSFDCFEIGGKKYSGKNLYDFFEIKIRDGYFNKEKSNYYNRDIIWYTWCGKCSPLFGKDKMATFERYFLEEEELHKEKKGYYYFYRENEKICDMILEEFGLDKDKGLIISGHVPVKCIDGESPVKANGKMIVIDGGFSKAYQRITGIAGYSLIYNSKEMLLVSHDPFETHEKSVMNNEDMVPHEVYVKYEKERMLVGDTEAGKDIGIQIEILNELLDAYRQGIVEQSFSRRKTDL